MAEEREVIIIGGGTAGTTAALTLAGMRENFNVTLISLERYPEYSRCSMPYIVSGKIKDYRNIIIYTEKFLKKVGINVLLEHEVLKIDTRERKIEVLDRRSNQRKHFKYDSLIICTGSTPVIPRGIKMENGAEFFTFLTLDDALRIKRRIGKVDKSVIVGGGLIGLELAEALVELGVHVTVVERDWILCSMLDEDISSYVKNMILENCDHDNLKILERCTVTEIGDGRVKLNTGETLESDLTVIATGVTPNVKLARESGIRIGKSGAIKVNARMETSVKGIYAAGDCAESTFLGHPIRTALGSLAFRRGIAAAMNVSGENIYVREPTLATTSKIFNVEIAAAGLPTRILSKMGVRFLSSKARINDKPSYISERNPILVKLLSSLQGRIIGCQIVGERAATMINEISAVMYSALPVDELLYYESAYTPSLSDIMSPIEKVARKLQIRLKRSIMKNSI